MYGAAQQGLGMKRQRWVKTGNALIEQSASGLPPRFDKQLAEDQVSDGASSAAQAEED
jgi:hypothetical protein